MHKYEYSRFINEKLSPNTAKKQDNLTYLTLIFKPGDNKRLSFSKVLLSLRFLFTKQTKKDGIPVVLP